MSIERNKLFDLRVGDVVKFSGDERRYNFLVRSWNSRPQFGTIPRVLSWISSDQLITIVEAHSTSQFIVILRSNGLSIVDWIDIAFVTKIT